MKIIWIINCKCAYNSLQKLLRFQYTRIYPLNPIKNIDNLEKEFYDPENTYIFTNIREPLSRIISAYNFLLRLRMYSSFLDMLKLIKNNKNIHKNYYKDVFNIVYKENKNLFSILEHTMPITDTISNYTNKIDRYIKMETLEEDLHNLSIDLDIPIIKPTIHLNKSVKILKKKDITKEELELFNSIYEDDIKLYNSL